MKISLPSSPITLLKRIARQQNMNLTHSRAFLWYVPPQRQTTMMSTFVLFQKSEWITAHRLRRHNKLDLQKRQVWTTIKPPPIPMVVLNEAPNSSSLGQPSEFQLADETNAHDTHEDVLLSSPVFAVGSTFADLNLHPDIVSALQEQGFTVPTHVQRRAIPIILKQFALARAARDPEVTVDKAERDVVVAAETGCGKTLAYLLPIMNELYTHYVASKREEDKDEEDVVRKHAVAPMEKVNKITPLSEVFPPKALILAPTQELCRQIRTVITTMFPPHLRLASLVLAGNSMLIATVNNTDDLGNASSQADDEWGAFPERCGIIIATPSGVLRLARAKLFKECDYIVVDEADMLLEGSFLRDVERVLDTLKPRISNTFRRELERRKTSVAQLSKEDWKGRGRTVVYAGATYPHWVNEKSKSVINWLRRRTPDFHHVETSLLHRANPAVEQHWIELDDSTLALKNITSPNQRNDLPTTYLANKVAEVLYSGDNDKKITTERVMIFVNSASEAALLASDLRDLHPLIGASLCEIHKDIHPDVRLQNLDEFQTGRKSILLCTDIASRGLDLGIIDHIIQAQFANNVVHHIHRIGRTARAGNVGRVTNFYRKSASALPLAIRDAQDEGRDLAKMFSRNRLFRGKVKKAGKTRTYEGSESESESESE